MSDSKLLRKVQLTGGSTYVVSVPKDWARKLGIKPGDYLKVIPQPDMSLLIVPEQHKTEKEGLSEASINASDAEAPDYIAREVIACYLVGCDIIRLKFGRKAAEYRAYVKDIMRRKLVGVETIEESADYIVIRCLLGYTEFPIREALNRMHAMALSMHRDAIMALKSGDISLAKDVVQRDDEIDRLYFFVVRQLNMAIGNRFVAESIGLSSSRDCLDYRLVAKSIERIADHATRIAQKIPVIERTNTDYIIALISEMSNTSNNICQSAMESLNELSTKKANQAITKIAEVAELEKEIIEQILQAKLDTGTTIGLRLILESIRRTAEYGTDIAEVAINLARK